jgi:cellulose synthase/poly-beta-1,6-N-acetylglucosamine synthase-like glycosyltransferase
MSAGAVVGAPASGPVLRPGRVERTARADTFTPILAPRDRIVVALLTAGWFICLVAFWRWWFEPTHRVGWFGLILNSTLLLYLSAQPAFFLLLVNRLRMVRRDIKVPALRVALVVTRAPSEPWAVASATLLAMLGQQYGGRYDVWLCDEDPSEEILRWCAANGVYVSTRRDAPEYHRPIWPRRTRCKEGNLAFFYDNWGYTYYDVVAQLDCDHVPAPTYLAEMVRPFADPAIGYVAAPSVCDTNAAESWAARGRLHREASFHGPFQAGHIAGLAPSCIGSHYAVRTAALREIGGVGPELAEDFSTSFLLTSAGWEGAFALEADARGDGPSTFSAMVTQEFQWSRSLVTVLYDLVPGHLRRLPWRLRIRFLNGLLYYPLLATTTVVGLTLPPIAALTGVPWVSVNYVEFLLRWCSVTSWLLLIIVLLRRRGLLRPVDAPVVSWELWLSTVARWPFIVWGVIAATLQKLRPRPIGFKVTPKGRGGLERLPAALVLPFVAIVVVMSGAAAIGERTTAAAGYVLLCLFAAVAYAVTALAICMLHAVETGRSTGVTTRQALRATAMTPFLVSIGTLPLLTLALVQFPAYAVHTFGW